MADFSSYTHKWRATNNNQSDANKISKRNRQPTSCQSCRIRKLKCDRGHPCESCVKRGEEESCHYGKTAATVGGAVSHSSRKEEANPSGRAQERLRQLESLVRQMVRPSNGGISIDEDRTHSAADTAATAAAANEAEGPLDRDRHGVNYTGSTHWSAVLDQIQELRTALSTESSPNESDGTDVDNVPPVCSIFGASQPPPLSVIIEMYLPPRQQVDRYLSTYFNAKYLVVPILHTTQFQHQYERFWQDPLATSPVWLSILFSIICIAHVVRQSPRTSTGASPPDDTLCGAFITASAHCLILGDYTRPQPHLIEALGCHMNCKYYMSMEPSREISLILPIVIRQAYTMGYHRDASKFPGQFSILEGEMRRRCWSALRQVDLMISFQLGIPQNIQPESWDVLPPHHIQDSDFDENTTFLPGPRPETEPSLLLYFIVKGRIMGIYGEVVRHSLSFPSQPFTHTDAMALESKIKNADDSIPAVLRARPMSLSFSDPPYLIMLRTNIMFVVQKSLCILHRKYMTKSTKEAAYSRNACITASTKVVQHFMELNMETGPDGQLEPWMISSFIINDFLLAAMLLCFTLWQERKDFLSKGGEEQGWLDANPEARGRYDLLESARRVCEEHNHRSTEMRRVADAIALILAKVRENSPRSTSGVDTSSRQKGGRNFFLNMTGMTMAHTPPEAGSKYNQTMMMPDLSPLSMNNNNNGNKNNYSSSSPPPTTSSSNSTGLVDSKPTSTNDTNTTYSDSSGMTWTYNTAPSVSSTSQDPWSILPTTTTTTTGETDGNEFTIKTNTSSPSPFPFGNHNHHHNHNNQWQDQQPQQNPSMSMSMSISDIPIPAPFESLLSESGFDESSSSSAVVDWTAFDQFLVQQQYNNNLFENDANGWGSDLYHNNVVVVGEVDQRMDGS